MKWHCMAHTVCGSVMKWHCMAHTVCGSVPPLHHGKGKPLALSRKLALRAAFSAIVNVASATLTEKIKEYLDYFFVLTTKRSVGRRNYMAHTVWRYEMALYGTHCVRRFLP